MVFSKRLCDVMHRNKSQHPNEVTRTTKTTQKMSVLLKPPKRVCTINSKINGTSQRCLLAPFEATFDLSRSEFTCT